MPMLSNPYASYDQKPWLAFYDPGLPKSLLPHRNISIHGQLVETVARDPDALAMIVSAALPLFGRKSISYTWRQINDSANRMANALIDLGLRKGDVVALVMPNCVQFVIAMFGVLKADGVVSAVNPTYPADKMAQQFKDANVKIAVTLTMFYTVVKNMQPQTGLKTVIATNIKEYLPPLARTLFTLAREKKEGHRVTLAAEDHWMQTLLAKYPATDPAVQIDPATDIALYQYTGGTTGVAKGAMATHLAIVANTRMIREWIGENDPKQIRIVGALPFFHVYGLISIVCFGASAGASIVVIPNARAVDDVLETIHLYRPTLFPCVPALYNAINNHPLVTEHKVNLRSIRYCISGSAPLAPETKRRFEELTGSVITEAFGMSETPTASHANPLRRPGKAQSVGTPLFDVDCRIVSLSDGITPMPVGQSGEMIIRAPNLMKGYLNQPAETANALRDIDGDGRPWLYTGDIAYMDADGYFFIIDRKKDMAILGGFNVYPSNIEKVIASHPVVQDVGVAVIKHADRPGEERLLACVVVRPNHQLSKDGLVAWQAEKLAPYEVARRIVFVPELPKTAVGKTLRRELATFAQQFEKQT
jgi:long-chain acyl-CoA synthetase